ncbi:Glycosyltransferase involved in cell wall biogenesis [Pyrobaculum sp. WP30]|nr:Glycosyltransferase involved in cell wall biogenesis [Pyrobaculum sp. WP30]
MDLLTALGAALAAAHFGAPLAYYAAKKRIRQPWRVRPDPAYASAVTVTPRLEIIVVDSASTDGTAERARRWAQTHPDLDVRMVEEPRGAARRLL